MAGYVECVCFCVSVVYPHFDSTSNVWLRIISKLGMKKESLTGLQNGLVTRLLEPALICK